MKYKLLLTLFIVLAIFITIYLYIHLNIKYNLQEINKGEDRSYVNINALPLIENDKKYIEEQTKIWIDRREKDEICYGMLEKDKIIMAKWIKHFNIRSPKIHYYSYHSSFKKEHLREIIKKNNDKRLVIKISHLQSNYGIIMVKGENERGMEFNDYIDKLYEDITNRFKSCFVCNHDRNDPPTNSEIKRGKKKSYYKLYETVEPGIIIQDFFYTREGKVEKPKEMKILCLGGNIIKYGFVLNIDRYKKVFEFAKDISAKLGSSLIRVDVFVKESDDPYIPYLNEISLSPNGGLNNTYLLSRGLAKQYKEKIKSSEKIKMDYIDNLCKSAPRRTLPIGYYLSDADSWKEKFSF